MSGKLYYKIDTFIQEYDGESPIVIFGTGDYGQFVFDKLSAAEIRVDFFTCNSKARYGSTYCGVRVCPPKLAAGGDAFIVIAVVGAYSKRDILYQLLEAGVRRERIVIPIEPVGSLFSDSRLKEIPEFSEFEKAVTLENIQKGREYFREYFLTNDLLRIATTEKNAFSDIVEELLSGTAAEIHYIRPDSVLDGFDAVVLTDRENFIFQEEQLMERMGMSKIPVIDFWSVVKKV